MQIFTYTKSASLAESLTRIDELRTQILLTPLSPRTEQQLQWETLLNRIYYEVALQGTVMSHEQIATYLSPLGSKIPHSHAPLVQNLKQAYDHLYHHWLVNTAPVSSIILEEFYSTIFHTTMERPEQDLDNNLKYIQVTTEHPVIQASLAQLLILRSASFPVYNEPFAHLIFTMMLYRHGYDMRRLVVFEEYHYNNLPAYKDMIVKANKLKNVTPWLEYCAASTITSLEKAVQYIQSIHNTPPRKDLHFDLNERQKLILTLFIQPNMKITNKLVQRKCKVSQITASRDLSKLNALGLIFSLGKGRNTYYTKV